MSEELLAELVAEPWTKRIGRTHDGFWSLSVRELDDFEIFGATRRQVVEESPSALRCHLRAYLATGTPIRLPSRQAGLNRFVWNAAPPARADAAEGER